MLTITVKGYINKRTEQSNQVIQNIGDEIFFLWKNRLLKSKIEEIKLGVVETDYIGDGDSPWDVSVRYVVFVDDRRVKIPADKAFITINAFKKNLKIDDEFC